MVVLLMNAELIACGAEVTRIRGAHGSTSIAEARMVPS
jgi:hypothetical protein